MASQHHDRATLTAPLSKPTSIAVIGAHPNAHVAYIGALLAQILLAHRGESVLAVDADIPHSPMRRWLTDSPRDSLNQILSALGVRHRGTRPDQPVTRSWIVPRLAPGTAVPLLAVDPATPGPELRRPDYTAALQRLQRWYPLLLTHAPEPQPTNITVHTARRAGRILLVSDDSAHGREAAAKSVQWLRNSAGDECVQRAVVVMQSTNPRKPPQLEGLPSTVDVVPAPQAPQNTPGPTALGDIADTAFVAAQHAAATALSTLVNRDAAGQAA